MRVNARADNLTGTIRAIRSGRFQLGFGINSGITKCTGVILRKALYYVPRDTGDLASTGRTRVTGRGFGTRGEVSFGGPAASGKDVDYAGLVHEDLQARHDPPTCAKYLERAYRETRGTCTSILKRDLEMT